MFKTVYLYIKVSTNQVEISNLKTGECISRKAPENFSTSRIVVSNFNKIHKLLVAMLHELNISGNIFVKKRILIQQTENLDGGLSDIEKRALRDVAEQCGAGFVVIAEHTNILTGEEAIKALL